MWMYLQVNYISDLMTADLTQVKEDIDKGKRIGRILHPSVIQISVCTRADEKGTKSMDRKIKQKGRDFGNTQNNRRVVQYIMGRVSDTILRLGGIRR